MNEIVVSDIIKAIDQLAPPHFAESWDPVGLSFGTVSKRASKVLIALDVDKDTVKEAINQKVDMIVTHHPAIFKPLTTLNGEDSRRQDYLNLIKSDIAVYSAHTNLDAADGGLNDWLADTIGISKEQRKPMTHQISEGYKKIAVYVPEHASEKVREALHVAGAGEVGDYKDVSYTLEGKGRFTPQEGADPADGEIGRQELTHELRIEMMVKDKEVQKVLEALKQTHPYEEPVFDLYTLEDKKDTYGYGRVGNISTGQTAIEMAKFIQHSFKVDGVRFGTVNEERKHNRIAIFGGSGEKYYQEAIDKGATLFITGDISYHGAQDMLRDGLDFIDAGHYMEAISISHIADYLSQVKHKENWDLEIIETVKQKDVFKYL